MAAAENTMTPTSKAPDFWLSIYSVKEVTDDKARAFWGPGAYIYVCAAVDVVTSKNHLEIRLGLGSEFDLGKG